MVNWRPIIYVREQFTRNVLQLINWHQLQFFLERTRHRNIGQRRTNWRQNRFIDCRPTWTNLVARCQLPRRNVALWPRAHSRKSRARQRRRCFWSLWSNSRHLKVHKCKGLREDWKENGEFLMVLEIFKWVEGGGGKFLEFQTSFLKLLGKEIPELTGSEWNFSWIPRSFSRALGITILHS